MFCAEDGGDHVSEEKAGAEASVGQDLRRFEEAVHANIRQCKLSFEDKAVLDVKSKGDMIVEEREESNS